MSLSRLARRTILFCSTDFREGARLVRQRLSKSSPGMWNIISCDHDQVEKHLPYCDVAVPLMGKLDRKRIEMGANAKLKLIYQYGAGLEGVDFEAAKDNGIAIANIPAKFTGNGMSTSELALFLLLGLIKKYHETQVSLKNREIGYPLGGTLSGKTVAIIGFGSIGKELAKRLRACEVKIIGVRRGKWTPEDASMCDIVARMDDSMMEEVREADAVVTACPLNNETRGMINSDFLSQMRKGLLLINVARGGIVDKDAVFEGLESGRLGGYAADVHWQEPFPYEEDDPEGFQGGVGPLHALRDKGANVMLTPHVGGITELTYGLQTEMFSDRVEAFFSSEAEGILENWGYVEGNGCALPAITRPNWQFEEEGDTLSLV
mmetsp:Transcript_22381/g.33341  ORF Transcript_22381/g.33341 Transcript_22381/m.33341 type:complete len:377 (+) Transcript_22381:165-1295(+)|eukprot:CAMPEP_0167753460 /NCGR_PEP_ID=MMETSP0110_2-20121227/7727_1 /TAXON_ID=629695 /ORGANISM="Gymnochlora sp., Strain CCMP2014" /LENGTH=376 /DNA_ID=CAMNT_0007639231 /DNA_START=106 /DNA_END=1236 /DNA_ORIENTATION=-